MIQVLPAVAHFVARAAQTAVKVVTGIVDHEFTPSVHVSIPIQAGPPASKLEDSPFGKAFKIYEYKMPDGDPKKEKETSNLAKLKDMLLPEKNPPVAGVTFYVSIFLNDYFLIVIANLSSKTCFPNKMFFLLPIYSLKLSCNFNVVLKKKY